MTAPLKPGDVLHYRPDQHHCREGVALVDGGAIFDTFWSTRGSRYLLTAADLETAEVQFNVNDYEALSTDTPHASREKWETYHPDDRGRIPSQHGLQEALFIRRGAKPDLAVQIDNTRVSVKNAEAEVRSAQHWLECRRRELAELLERQRRRQEIELHILALCAEGPRNPRGIALSIYRNHAEVRGIMMELTTGGRLESRDGYKTFRTVGS